MASNENVMERQYPTTGILRGLLLPGDFCVQSAKSVELNSHRRDCRQANNDQGKGAESTPRKFDSTLNASENTKSFNLADTKKYFREAIQFLHKFSWVYDFQVTQFLIENQAEKVPAEWKEYLRGLSWMDLNILPFTSVLPGIPDSLADYIRTCQRLSLSRCPEKETSSSQNRVMPEMNPKKSHEILKMAKLVKEVTTAAGSQLIVDVGAGLGYLSTLLAKEYSLDVLALECKDYLTHGAELRSNKQDAEFLEAVTFRVEDSQECFSDMQNLLREKLMKTNTDKSQLSKSSPKESPINKTDQNYVVRDAQERHVNSCDMDSTAKPGSSREGLGIGEEEEEEGRERGNGACMIGLHCCGSLTPTMLKMFLSSEEFQALTCVSCCYHGMEQRGPNKWKHFPLSETLTDEWKGVLPTYDMSVFGLRLAAQETMARWGKQTESDHDYHSRNMGYRALLEYVCHKDGISLEKTKRKMIRRSDMTNLETFSRAVMSRTNLDSSSNISQRLHEEHQLHLRALALVEPFTALQVCMQSVLESLILIDRVTFLRESGVEAVLVPIFDDSISPRNMAVLALKS